MDPPTMPPGSVSSLLWGSCEGLLQHGEQRHQPRVELEAPATIQRSSGTSRVGAQEGVARNLSLGGAYIVLSHPASLAPGQIVQASLAIPSRYWPEFPLSRLAGQGRVMRIDDLGLDESGERCAGVAMVFDDALVMHAAVAGD